MNFDQLIKFLSKNSIKIKNKNQLKHIMQILYKIKIINKQKLKLGKILFIFIKNPLDMSNKTFDLNIKFLISIEFLYKSIFNINFFNNKNKISLFEISIACFLFLSFFIWIYLYFNNLIFTTPKNYKLFINQIYIFLSYICFDFPLLKTLNSITQINNSFINLILRIFHNYNFL